VTIPEKASMARRPVGKEEKERRRRVGEERVVRRVRGEG
jgi:hypothetical protein